MNKDKDKKYHSLVIFFLLTIFTITIFTIAMPFQNIFASGITIYSPYWMNYEKDLKSPYFKYCGIFDSCLGNDIRIFPFLPLTSQAQNDEAQNDEDNNIGTRNTLSSIIPFQLPFP